MTQKSLPEIDAYIANAPEYAVPILEDIRSMFHASDDDIEEAVKWNAPHFVRDGIVGSMTAFKNHVREAIDLNRRGVKTVRDRSASDSPVGDEELPDDLRKALESSPEALESYEAFSPSQQREYTEWITEAKREETRNRRIVTAVEWLAEGKPRNWKYMDKWRSDGSETR